MNRKVSLVTLAKIQASRRRANRSDSPILSSFLAGVCFAFLFFVILFQF
jgi:hypothetical protein